MEKFDPSDQKYKKVEDLPNRTQSQFKPTKDGTGFVRNSVPLFEEFKREYRNPYESPENFDEALHMLAVIEDMEGGAEAARRVNEALRSFEAEMVTLVSKVSELYSAVVEANAVVEKTLVPLAEVIREKYRAISRKNIEMSGHDGWLSLELGDPDSIMGTSTAYDDILKGVIDGRRIDIRRKGDRYHAHIDDGIISPELGGRIYKKFVQFAYDKETESEEIFANRETLVSPETTQKQNELYKLREKISKLKIDITDIETSTIKELKEALIIEPRLAEKFKMKQKEQQFESLLK